MILNNLHLFPSLFSARAYALAEGDGTREFRPLHPYSLETYLYNSFFKQK